MEGVGVEGVFYIKSSRAILSFHVFNRKIDENHPRVVDCNFLFKLRWFLAMCDIRGGSGQIWPYKGWFQAIFSFFYSENAIKREPRSMIRKLKSK